MSIPVSTVPSVTAYLLSAIEAAVATDPLTVSGASKIYVFDGNPPTRRWPNDVIIVGQVRMIQDLGAFTGGGGPFTEDEHYDITVSCRSWSGGTDPTEVRTRAWQLAGYVQVAVRNDLSLGHLVDQAFPAGATANPPQFTKDPTGVSVTVTQKVHIDNLN